MNYDTCTLLSCVQPLTLGIDLRYPYPLSHLAERLSLQIQLLQSSTQNRGRRITKVTAAQTTQK